MKLKNAFLKVLDFIENINISPLYGYSLATIMLIFNIILNFAQYSLIYGGGSYIKIWTYLSYILFWISIVLFALTKKKKYYGMKISRIFSILFVFLVGQLSNLLPSEAYMNGDCYVNPMDMIIIILLIVSGFMGYSFGKYISKKIKNKPNADAKYSQG